MGVSFLRGLLLRLSARRGGSSSDHGGSSTRGRWLARARVVSQALFALAFLVLLLKTEVPPLGLGSGTDLRLPYPTSIFLEADPLVGLSTTLSTGSLHQGLLWGVAVLLLTLLVGRAFCGWICPLGTAQHLLSWWARGWKKKGQQVRSNRYRPSMRLKFYLLAGLLAASFFTTVQIGLLDPICLTLRSLGLSIIPAIDEAIRLGLQGLQRSDLAALQHLGDAGQTLRGHVLPMHATRIEGAWLLGLLFLALLFVGLKLTRFWCRYVCPLGALLGPCSRFSLFGLQKDEEKCTHCNQCLLTCQGACEPIAGSEWRAAECHLCFNCEASCPEDALHFRFLPGLSGTRRDADLTRRAVLGSILGGAAALPLLRSSAGFAGRRGRGASPELIRPPGALAEEEFLARCLKCGACMKVCPTNGLHPTLMQAGLEGLWTPVLVPRIGYCEPSCTLCGQVCPTGAIHELSVKRKTGQDGARPLKIGTAFYDRGRCLPWAMDTPCIVCEEWCPVSPKAIWLEPATARRKDGSTIQLQRPHVDPARCTGCGACEYACPVSDRPAIRVSSIGESRHPHSRLLLGSK